MKKKQLKKQVKQLQHELRMLKFYDGANRLAYDNALEGMNKYLKECLSLREENRNLKEIAHCLRIDNYVSKDQLTIKEKALKTYKTSSFIVRLIRVFNPSF